MQSNLVVWTEDTEPVTPSDKEIVIVPTLEEFIEECGEEFGRLVRVLGGEWEAHHRISLMGNEKYRTGSSPLEAVINLWLEINK